jgi:hypothetical protein
MVEVAAVEVAAGATDWPWQCCCLIGVVVCLQHAAGGLLQLERVAYLVLGWSVSHCDV